MKGRSIQLPKGSLFGGTSKTLGRGLGMEPAVGVEPTTYGLQNRCSTTELSWRRGGRYISRDLPRVKPLCPENWTGFSLRHPEKHNGKRHDFPNSHELRDRSMQL